MAFIRPNRGMCAAALPLLRCHKHPPTSSEREYRILYWDIMINRILYYYLLYSLLQRGSGSAAALSTNGSLSANSAISKRIAICKQRYLQMDRYLQAALSAKGGRNDGKKNISYYLVICPLSCTFAAKICKSPQRQQNLTHNEKN